MASISSLICKFRSRLARFACSGEPRFRLFDLEDVDPKETSEEAADEDVEQADGDVENGFDRRAREAFNCFLFNINLEDGDKVGEIGADDDDCAISSGLVWTSSSVADVAICTIEATLALELGLRGFSDFLSRITAAVEGPSDPPTPPSPLVLLLLLCEESLA